MPAKDDGWKATLAALKENHQQWCVHYNGYINETCEAGVNYAELLKGEKYEIGSAYYRPCIVAGPIDVRRKELGITPVPCQLLKVPTEAEAEEHARQAVERLKQRAALITAGICTNCGGKLEPRRVVGRCAYGACGCRLGIVR